MLKLLEFLKVPNDNPALTLAQFEAFSKQVPLLYFILLTNMASLAFTHAGTALFFGFDSEQLLAEFRQLFESAGGCECAVTRTASGDIAVRLFGYTADKLQRMIAEASRIAGDQLKM